MDVFAVYEREAETVKDQIRENLDQLVSPEGADSRALIKKTSDLFDQAADLIKQMNLEVRSHQVQARVALTERVSEISKLFPPLKSEFERIREKTQRSALIGDSSTADRSRVLNVNDK